MAGTLCLADVQLTAFQAYKKLIKLKIEFVTINCQEYCQHFQPGLLWVQPLADQAAGDSGVGGWGCVSLHRTHFG